MVVATFFYTNASVANADLVDCVSIDCLGGIAYGEAGFLLVAPDRGYAGNQKVRKSFVQLEKKHNAELVFITDERMEPYLKKALNQLNKKAKKIVVLPLFFSTAHPKLTSFRKMLTKLTEEKDIIFARSFGNSYLAVEMLIERLKAMDLNEKNDALVLVAHGADTDKTLKLMRRDFLRIADLALKDFSDKTIDVVVLPGDRYARDYRQRDEQAWAEIKKLGKTKGGGKAIPLHLGPELDGMMSVNSWVEDKLPKSMQIAKFDDNEVALFSLWMQREANRYLSSKEAPLGIVFNAHGSDFHWNQGMRDAVEELTQKYPVEFAFSMADADDLRQAVSRLENRGVGVIVVVRVFGMRASFRHSVERLIGLDIDAPELCKTEDEDDKHEGELPKRLRTTALVVTEGGLGDSPLFARSMLEKAQQLSTNIANDTVIIVAHGKGSDTANQQWLNVLSSLVKQMKAMGGDKFKDIFYQTWQEDWEDKRGDRISAVLKMVNDANKEGGNAIIIPARTTGEGRAKSFLKDANYKAAKGFAPHPLFSIWIEQQLVRGAETVKQTRHVWYPALSKELELTRK